jgi:phosphoglycolate phosphatase
VTSRPCSALTLDIFVSRYKLVAFDFDGTLADSASWFKTIINGIAAKHRFKKVREEDFERLRNLPNREIIRELGIRTWQLPAIARDMRRHSAIAAKEIALFPGVQQLLHDASRAGLRVAIVTSNSEVAVRVVLNESVDHIAEFACGASLFGKASRLRRIRRSASVEPADMLYIGDQIVDLEAARAAGADSGAVTWGYADGRLLAAANPTYLFASITDLRAAIGL